MSYQLAFWKTGKRLPPDKVYKKIMDEKLVRGLEPLDRAAVERRLIATFPKWTLDTSITTVQSQTAISSDHGAVDVFYTAQAAVCTCVGLANEDLNRIIDMMHAMDMPLYDPQTGERFGL